MKRLTKEISDDIAEMVATGSSWSQAARAYNIDRESFLQWILKGRKEPATLHGELVRHLTFATQKHNGGQCTASSNQENIMDTIKATILIKTKGENDDGGQVIEENRYDVPSGDIGTISRWVRNMEFTPARTTRKTREVA